MPGLDAETRATMLETLGNHAQRRLTPDLLAVLTRRPEQAEPPRSSTPGAALARRVVGGRQPLAALCRPALFTNWKDKHVSSH